MIRLSSYRGAALKLSALVLLAFALSASGGPGRVSSAAAAQKRMNIVFVLTDDESIESVAKMPFLSGFGRWVRFENAFINDPMCCPSRATLLTGQYAHHTGIENNTDRGRFDESSTIATWLHAAGYQTAMFGKYHLGLHGRVEVPPGWDDWASFDGAYYNYTLNENGHPVYYGWDRDDYSTDVLAAKAARFVRRVPSGKPFFVTLSTRAPHDSYVAAPRYLGRFAGTPVPHAPSFNEPDVSDKPSWWRSLAPRDPRDIDNARRKQYASLLAVDDALKSIVDVLTSRSILDDTVIVFMTDNGVAFGEHRWRGKGCAYDECVRTPLLISYPGGTPRTVSQLVSNVDIAPTFAELGGTKPATPVDGHSLVPFLTGANPSGWPEEVLLRFKHDASQLTPPSFWGIRTPRYKYIETQKTGEVELYDLASDPSEVQNVARQPQYAQIRARLARRLAELRGAPPHRPEAPDTTIVAGPFVTKNASPQFRFGSTKSKSTFQCRLDSTREADWQSCASPKVYSDLLDGTHTFEVRAIDSVGNMDRTPASRAFTVDTKPLGTRITQRPKLKTADRTPRFRFRALGGIDLRRFECSVDRRRFRVCSSPKTIRPKLRYGRHTFRVRAVDRAGNVDRTPARAGFEVKRT